MGYSGRMCCGCTKKFCEGRTVQICTIVFDMLIKRGFSLNYFKNDKNTQEIEFLYSKDGSVIPVEVKSKNGATLSLNKYNGV